MGWYEVASIGLEVAQYSELRRIHSSFIRKELHEIAETRLEDARARLRSIAFQAVETIRELLPALDESPLRVYVHASLVERLLVEVGMDPDFFPTFADKEYVADLRRKLRTLLGQSYQRLSPDERKRALKVQHWLVEMPALEEAITVLQAREDDIQHSERLKETRTQLDQLTRKRNWLVALSLLLACIIPSVVSQLASLVSDEYQILTTAGLCGGFAAPMLAGIYFLSVERRPEVRALNREYKELAIAPQPDHLLLSRDIGKYTDYPLSKLKEVHDSRLRFIARTISGG